VAVGEAPCSNPCFFASTRDQSRGQGENLAPRDSHSVSSAHLRRAHDDPHSLLLAAKALVFCGFPYQRSPLTTIVREAHLGTDTHLTVYLSTTEPNVPTP